MDVCEDAVRNEFITIVMKLSASAIQDFQEAYFKDFGVRIDEQEAAELGQRLITLLSVIYKPIPKHE